MDDRPASAQDANPPGSAPSSVVVAVRIRPVNDREHGTHGAAGIVVPIGAKRIQLSSGERTELFEFDDVMGENVKQDEVYERIGLPLVSNVMAGFNACCLAYGQTGAGKTHTMQGKLRRVGRQANPDRGLVPRVLEAIFREVEEQEMMSQSLLSSSSGSTYTGATYTCRCSFLQIHNEHVSDLLVTGDKPLALRLEPQRGVYVEGLTELVVVNTEEAMAIMSKGSANRKTRETAMNYTSSRSHSVFTLTVECRKDVGHGVTQMRYGRVHMVDLAGSERVSLSGAAGAAFTEACDINLSLTMLGRVISKVVEAQTSKQALRHVPYRDSKLTFLLKDSLGGNSRTFIVANVSPSAACTQETMSTLQFAERAKHVRTRAYINVATQADIKLMQAEIEQLAAELSQLQNEVLPRTIAERDEARQRLAASERAHARTTEDMQLMAKDHEHEVADLRAQHKDETNRLREQCRTLLVEVYGALEAEQQSLRQHGTGPGGTPALAKAGGHFPGGPYYGSVHAQSTTNLRTR